MGLAGQRLKREAAALARGAAGAGRPAGDAAQTGQAIAFLDHGIPLAAGLALALPAGRGRAAVLADEGLIAAGHLEILGKSLRILGRILAIGTAETVSLAGEHFKNIKSGGSGLPHALEAMAETGQHLVGNGAGLRCYLVEAQAFANQRDHLIAAARADPQGGDVQ